MKYITKINSCLLLLLLLSIFLDVPPVLANPPGLRFYLREHKDGSSDPQIQFSKTGGVIDIYTWASYVGDGIIMLPLKRLWLNGKKISIRRKINLYGIEERARVLIFDGKYDYSDWSNDFPDGSSMAIKGSGLLATLWSWCSISDWGSYTSSSLDLTGGTETYCTLMLRLNDSTDYFYGDFYIDYIKILDADNNVLYDEPFSDSIHMEVTGTYHDYGYISEGEVEYPSEGELVEPVRMPPLEAYIMLGMGLGGIGLMVLTPWYFIKRFRQKREIDALCWGTLMFLIGLGFTIGWLWG